MKKLAVGILTLFILISGSLTGCKNAGDPLGSSESAGKTILSENSVDSNKNSKSEKLPVKSAEPAGAAAENSLAATTFRYVNFENASINGTTYDLTENGTTYPFIKKGDFRPPVLTSSQWYKGSRGIEYQMGPTSGTAADGNTTDKSQHRIIAGSDPKPLVFGQKKYWSFAVKFDPATDDPETPTQFFQWWQGTPMSPPLELRLKHGGSGTMLKYELVYRNNTTTANPSACKPICEGTIQKDTWNTFVVMTLLRNTGDAQDGEVKLWQNGAQRCDWFGRVGYADGIVYGGKSYTPNKNFDVFFGPYRPRQMTNLKMYFDQVRYTDAYVEASLEN